MKEEQFRKAKEHLNYIYNLVKEDKRTRRKYRGHLIHNLYDNVALGSLAMITYSIGLSALFLLVAHIPLGLAIAFGCMLGFVGSFVVPRVIHFAILRKAKGKLGRGYCKLEMDYHYEVMKWYYKKYYSKVLNAQSSDELTDRELKQFGRQAAIFVENAKYTLNYNVLKRIAKRNDKDLNKVKKLYNTIEDRDVLQAKVDKILSKNAKFTQPWCDLYNECAEKVRDLYVQVNGIDNSFEVLANKEFGANKNALRDMIYNRVDKSLVVTEKRFNQNSLESEHQNQNIKYTHKILSKKMDKEKDMIK